MIRSTSKHLYLLLHPRGCPGRYVAVHRPVTRIHRVRAVASGAAEGAQLAPAVPNRHVGSDHEVAQNLAPMGLQLLHLVGDTVCVCAGRAGSATVFAEGMGYDRHTYTSCADLITEHVPADGGRRNQRINSSIFIINTTSILSISLQ